MIHNIQYKFKPENMSPGPDGSEACVDRYLTEYAMKLGLQAYVIQVWKGQGEESHVEDFIIFDSASKKPIFSDRRSQVIEYILETIASQMQNQQGESEDQTSS